MAAAVGAALTACSESAVDALRALGVGRAVGDRLLVGDGGCKGGTGVDIGLYPPRQDRFSCFTHPSATWP